MKVVLGVHDGLVRVWEFVNAEFLVNQLRWGEVRRRGLGRVDWVDSGGYQFMMRGLRLGVREVLEAYRGIEARYYMALDEPPRELDGREALERNVALFEELYERFDLGGTLVPVIHFYYPVELMVEAAERYARYSRVVAYGGIIPPLLRRTRYRFPSLAGVAILRKVWRGTIHVLGAGSPIMLYLATLAGADSADTSTWRVKAAYGHVLIPGKGERSVGRSRTWATPRATAEDLALLRSFLERTGFPMLGSFKDMIKGFTGRAVINAWVVSRTDPGSWGAGGFSWLKDRVSKVITSGLDEAVSCLNEYVRLAMLDRVREASSLRCLRGPGLKSNRRHR